MEATFIKSNWFCRLKNGYKTFAWIYFFKIFNSGNLKEPKDLEHCPRINFMLLEIWITNAFHISQRINIRKTLKFAIRSSYAKFCTQKNCALKVAFDYVCTLQILEEPIIKWKGRHFVRFFYLTMPLQQSELISYAILLTLNHSVLHIG